MRIAFLTPEYPTSSADQGGLATYVHRMAHLLKAAGHEAEVFLTGPNVGRIDADGIIVHQVKAVQRAGVIGQLLRVVFKVGLLPTFAPLRIWVGGANALADALAEREREAPFDIVQSADYLATGLFVRRRAGRAHVVRCSSAPDLYNKSDGTMTRLEALRGFIERAAIRRADVAYAPSRLVADHFSQRHGVPVKVIRPSAAPPIDPLPAPFDLPPRYLIHFGQLIPRKGSDFLARTLPLVWERVPDLQMVWCGACWDTGLIENWRTLWGTNATKVHLTGPLERRVLAGVLRGAEGAVLPSQVDNLPNTVIESLSNGIPVIGTRGASIDELVNEGVTGLLVPFGDQAALADAIVAQWQGKFSAIKGFKWPDQFCSDFEPGTALANFLALADKSRKADQIKGSRSEGSLHSSIRKGG